MKRAVWLTLAAMGAMMLGWALRVTDASASGVRQVGQAIVTPRQKAVATQQESGQQVAASREAARQEAIAEGAPPPPPRLDRSELMAGRWVGRSHEQPRDVQALDKLADGCACSLKQSCPGSAPVPKPGTWPWNTERKQWMAELGDRATDAFRATVTEKECGSLHAFGDYTLCMEALQGQGNQTPLVGYSFGIWVRDQWSEYISNTLHIPVHLFDCFYGSAGRDGDNQGPFCHKCQGGEASALNVTRGRSNVCPPLPSSLPCYESPYVINRACLSTHGEMVPTHIGERPAALLSNLFAPHGELSIHMKIDVEGSEWEQFRWLLSSPETLMKIRTLDMEIHYTFFGLGKEHLNPKSEDEWHTWIKERTDMMERFLDAFAVSGSTLKKHFCKGPQPMLNRKPQWHYNTEGFGMSQLEVSYVNRALLRR